MNYSVLPLDGDIEIESVKEYITSTYKTSNIPEEWLLLIAFYKWELRLNEDLAKVFAAFVEKFYPNFKWFNEVPDRLQTVNSMCFFINNFYVKMFCFGMSGDIKLADGSTLELTETEKRYIERAKEFGVILKDFLIRYKGYVSVNHDTKIITCINDETDIRIQDLLANGYTLNRAQRLMYVRGENPLLGRKFVETDENIEVMNRSHFSL